MQHFGPGLLKYVALMCLLPCVPSASLAQAPDKHPRVIGTVVDAATMQALNGAYVEIQPTDPSTGARTQTVIANAEGKYAFRAIPPGRYTLRAESLGYQSAAVELVITEAIAPELLSLGLQVEPITLSRVNASASSHVPTFADASLPANDGAITLEHIRQQRFLEGDAKLLSFANTREMPVLGEPDLLRTFERLPGVATRDEYTTEVWIRGAAWNRAAVTFDRMPLFSPLHAGGAVSAISTDIVGNASLQPGAQWAGPLAGTAGSVMIDTRPALHDDKRFSAELTTFRAGGTAEGMLSPHGSWVISARRSHLDLVPRGLGPLHDGAAERLPYMFADIASRLDYTIDAISLEISGLWERDHLNGRIGEIIQGRNATRGSSAARASISTLVWNGELRATIGFSRFAVTSDSVGGYWDPGSGGAVLLPGMDNAITANVTELYWTKTGTSRQVIGVRLEKLKSHLWTDGKWPYRDSMAPFVLNGGVDHLTLWSQQRWEIQPGLTIEPGMTVYIGDAPAALGRARYAPRLAARVAVSERTLISLAGSRTYQFARALTPAGAGFHRVAFTDLFWLASDTVAPLRADIATATIEHWLAHDMLVSLAAYDRRAAGVSVASVRFGSLSNTPTLVQAGEQSGGVEVYARKVSGRWTTSLGYTYARTTLRPDSAASSFASPYDRRHTFDALFTAALPFGARAAVAYTVMSGAPYTRYLPDGRTCITPDDCETMGPELRPRDNPGRAHMPSAQRGEWYHSADVSLNWKREFSAVEAEVFLQIHNILGRDNSAAYGMTGLLACGDEQCQNETDGFVDEALPGLSRSISGGVRLRF